MEKKEITKAILAVMRSVKGIDKTLTVGSGASSYKGVSDKDVKNIIGEAMEKNGLCILPIGIEAKTQVDRWVENTNYGEKTKQNVLTEVKTRYLLLHESGESIEIEGYGHGVDSQDKSAGKATTYALKYALLYMFLVPTGTIDDTDVKHSEEIPVPAKELPWLSDVQFAEMKKAISEGKVLAVKGALGKYRIKKEYKQELDSLLK
jgi:hypothetical protein